jgi:NhaA family Na+:H+ antiporter
MNRVSRENRIFRKGEVFGTLLLRPFQSFAALQASGGILLAAVTIAGLLWANSSLAPLYDLVRHSQIEIRTSFFILAKSAHFWINEGLMTIFFFVVGLEIKRELLIGELASLRSALLPASAALGGMVVPALIYYGLNHGTPVARGWGIPMATDIAFTIGVLTLLGSRVPHPLKVFLAALAIVDDLGAVVVIATFYTSDLLPNYLLFAGLLLLILVAFNILGYRRPLPYLVVGSFVWMSVYLSGVHSTVAGILVAITIPSRSRYDPHTFLARAHNLLDEFQRKHRGGFAVCSDEGCQEVIRSLERVCRDVDTPLNRIEYFVHPWVVFLIVPVFALMNAGVELNWSSLRETLMSPASLGIILGLFVGKQVGIALAAWVSVRTGVAALPTGTTFGQVYAGAIICGVGFTMSIFIADLAFGDSAALDSAKISILAASLLSLLAGFAALWAFSIRRSPASQEGETDKSDE